MKIKIKLIIIVPAILAGIISCNPKETESTIDKEAVVSVNGRVLLRSDLQEIIPSGLSVSDSTDAAEAYIKLWINDELMYEKAQKNIADKKKIEELVNNYKQSLTVFTYQEQLLKEQFSRQNSDKAIKEYYDTHSDKFKLETNIIKGLFLKIPASSSELDNFRKWYKSTSTASLEYIDKNALQHALIYDYFYDKWVNMDDIISKIPYMIKNSDVFLKERSNLEVNDSAYVYLLNIKEYKTAGSIAPYEYAKPQVLEVMMNQKRKSFMEQFEKDLYDKAIKNDKIKYFYKKDSKE